MNDMVEVDFKDLMRIVIKRAWVVILCAVLAAAIVFVYTKNFVTPTYKASVTLYVNNNSEDSGMVSSSNLAVALQLVNTYVNIIQSDTVLQKVVEETGLNISADQVRDMLSAKVVEKTEMFEVSIISPNPQMSADIANAIASIAPAEIAMIIEGSSAKVIDYAKVPVNRHAPNYTRNTLLGGLLGAVFAVAMIVAFVVFDKRVKTENDLKKICDIPVLGAIPDFSTSAPPVKGTKEKQERRKA